MINQHDQRCSSFLRSHRSSSCSILNVAGEIRGLTCLWLSDSSSCSVLNVVGELRGLTCLWLLQQEQQRHTVALQERFRGQEAVVAAAMIVAGAQRPGSSSCSVWDRGRNIMAPSRGSQS
jgi:hypothetical protein